MPHVLFIGSGNPWQGGAGFLVRQNLFLGALAQVAELQLAMFDCKPGPVPEYAGKLTSLAKPTRSRRGRLKNWLDDRLDPLPRMLRGYDLSEPRQQVAALNPASFDAVFGYRIDFSYFAGVLNHPRLILDVDDPEHVRGYRRLQVLGAVADRRTLRDLQRLAAFERRAVAGAKLAFVCQDNDRQGWEKPPEVTPNCVQVVANPARNVIRPIVLFVGNCAGSAGSPNVDAVRFFLAKIWPEVLTAVPEAEFHIVGATSDVVRQAVAAAPRVTIRGFVEDLSAVYAEASLSIAPIRFGTGTRIKILEAFAHACPVVSTLAGAEGISAVPGKEIELAGGTHDFAQLTAALLNNPALNFQIGAGGHALALAQYDAVAQQRRLVSRLNEFLHACKLIDRKAAG